MHKIFKYEIPTSTVVSMPIGAKVLSVGVQGEKIFLWAKVDTEADLEDHTFIVVGTGWPCDFEAEFIGTVQFDSGYVFHVFEER